MFLLSLLAGCGRPREEESYNTSSPAPHKKEQSLFKKVAEADAKIDYLEKHIKSLKDFEKEEMHKGARFSGGGGIAV